MLLLFGWGKKSKKLADAGIMKCKNCNNYSTFEVRELAKNINVYFIPIAKWDKRTFLVCTICEAGYELTKEGREKILQEMMTIPDNKTSVEIFNKIDSLFVDYMKTKKEEGFKDWDKHIKKELAKEGYKKDDIDYVLPIYAANLIDEPDK